MKHGDWPKSENQPNVKNPPKLVEANWQNAFFTSPSAVQAHNFAKTLKCAVSSMHICLLIESWVVNGGHIMLNHQVCHIVDATIIMSIPWSRGQQRSTSIPPFKKALQCQAYNVSCVMKEYTIFFLMRVAHSKLSHAGPSYRCIRFFLFLPRNQVF